MLEGLLCLFVPEDAGKILFCLSVPEDTGRIFFCLFVPEDAGRILFCRLVPKSVEGLFCFVNTWRCWKDCSLCRYLKMLERLFCLSVPEDDGRIVLFCVYLKMLEGFFCLFVFEDARRIILTVCIWRCWKDIVLSVCTWRLWKGYCSVCLYLVLSVCTWRCWMECSVCRALFPVLSVYLPVKIIILNTVTVFPLVNVIYTVVANSVFQTENLNFNCRSILLF